MRLFIDFDGLIRLIEMRGDGRLIVGIAGPPGSGKPAIAGHLEKFWVFSLAADTDRFRKSIQF